MNTQDILDKFSIIQKEKGAGQAEIDEVIFTATAVANTLTIEEFKVKSPESLQEFKNKLQDSSQKLTVSLINEHTSEIVNDEGEKYIDVFNRHLKDFLDKLN